MWPVRLVLILLAVAVLAIAACAPQQSQQHDLFAEKGQSKNATECSSDTDCGVGECSGQVCTTSDKAAGLVTTCEYRAEYGCYKLTDCGCIAGKCVWKETPEFSSCLEKAKSQPLQTDQPQ